MKRSLASACLLLAAGLSMPAAAGAQEPQNERLVTADGMRLDFPPDGVWRRRARRVAAQRAQLRSRGIWSLLNAPAASGVAGAGAAMTGTLLAPAILIGYSDTDTSSGAAVVLPRRAEYDSIFFTTTPWRNRPYTQNTLYQEMSRNLLSIGGQAYGWVQASKDRTYYLDACGPSTNALDCSTGRFHMYQMFLDALRALDTTGTVDFGQYDNDGPDGVPNSGDDDGIVDVVQFVQPVVGGECRGRGIWAHKSSLEYLGGMYSTRSLARNGGTIKVGPYHLVAGVGGASCRDSTEIMGIGTASHELGHGLLLPDLYDVSGNTQGEGEWGLMGSANYTSLLSPGQFDAWCKDQLGWVVEVPLTATGTYSLGGVVSSDSIMLVRPRGANPRGEYFLLENKQAEGSDTSNMNTGGAKGPKLGGLLVWHIDSLKVAQNGFDVSNTVNAGLPHGVELVQADDSSQLDRPPPTAGGTGNRGDAGDPYPGRSANQTFSRTSAPAALLNGDSSFAGFALTSVAVANARATFHLAFATVIRPSDTLALVSVSGAPYHRFNDPLSADTATVGVPSPYTSADGRSRFTFSSWSDGGAQTHAISGSAIADSLVAAMSAEYQLKVTQTGTGAIAASPSANLSGQFFPGGTVITLHATAGPDSVFDGWSGDTASARDTLVLTMRRPYTLLAAFAPVLVAAADTAPVAIMGAGYTHSLPVQGGTGVYQWAVVGGGLAKGLYLYSDGRVAGTPEQTGAFDAAIRVSSGSQVATFPLHLVVQAPVIDLDAAVHQLVRLDSTLTAEQVKYFDLLGNKNGRLDLGDFLAWLQVTGITPSPQVMARVLAAPGGKR